MNWLKTNTHPWQEPLAMATHYSGGDMALLYSSRSEHYTGRYSFLLLEPIEHYEGHDWHQLPDVPSADEDGLPYYVGYVGYEMGMGDDAAPATIPMPGFVLRRYARLFRFDHAQLLLEEFTAQQPINANAAHATAALGEMPTPAYEAKPNEQEIQELRSNFTRQAYEHAVQATLTQIAAGNFYQANITRKFYGSFRSTPNRFGLFKKLCEASPAPFSAFLQQGDTAILSSSPELFLSVRHGVITSRPIKGSAPRGADNATDIDLQKALQSSSKNLAENLMITDLMRNDIAQVSAPGSVRVAEQSALYSYDTIHHLISAITGTKKSDATAYDIVRACFPPGSMTGAPKKAAVEWCAAQERMARGIYSGALGWFGTGDSCDVSVVIRTAICKADRFEFQVGGGIVADSTPEDEWRETLVKARGIARALGITEAQLQAL
jgi:anthranilate/para-aminobenzoate synthase component I